MAKKAQAAKAQAPAAPTVPEKTDEVVTPAPEVAPEAAPAAPEPTPEPVAPAAEVDDITIDDPEILRPKELPFVVKPPKAGWANGAQAEYARVLNAYAYSNPAKFKAKKETLVKNLKALAENPGLLNVLIGDASGGTSNLSFKNHITQGT